MHLSLSAKACLGRATGLHEQYKNESMVNCGMHLLCDEIVDYLRLLANPGESRVEGHLHSGFWKIRGKG